MRQLVSALRLVFLVALGWFAYRVYVLNWKPTQPPAVAVQAALDVDAQPVPGIPAPQSASDRKPEPAVAKRSAVVLAPRLQTAVYRIAEDFVRAFVHPRQVKFARDNVRVLGNRDFGFFIILSSLTGKNDTGSVVTVPWKAKVKWDDPLWRLYALEVAGESASFAGVNPRVLTRRGEDPRYLDPEQPEKTESAETAAAEQAAASQEKPAGTAPPKAASVPEKPAKQPQPKPASGTQDMQVTERKDGPEKPKDVPEKAKEAPEKAAKEVGESPMRTWTDASGQHKVEARFRGVSDGKVQLRKSDGKDLVLPLEKLSSADQEWIRSHAQ